jgi:hypothetical protein
MSRGKRKYLLRIVADLARRQRFWRGFLGLGWDTSAGWE